MSRSWKADLWDKTDGYCAFCGVKLNPWGNFRKALIVPAKEGGDPDDIDNLFAACTSCGASKGSRNLEEFRELLSRKKGMGFTDSQREWLRAAFGVNVEDSETEYVFYFEYLMNLEIDRAQRELYEQEQQQELEQEQ